MPEVKDDAHYREDLAACGQPFVEFASFCEQVPRGTVLDLGCGQGRDALMFARAGHRVLGVDVSSVGVTQMLATARSEGLDVEGVVHDIRSYRPDTTFDIVVLDRVLHMLDAADRLPMLASAMEAVVPGGHLLVAEGPKGMLPVRQAVEQQGWSLPRATRNRLIARRPPAPSVVLTLGSQPLSGLVVALRRCGVLFNAYAEALLASGRVEVAAAERTVRVVVHSVGELGWAAGAPLDEVLRDVVDRGLEPCPLEVALLLRLEWRDNPVSPRVTVASRRAHPDAARPRGLYLRDDADGCWLRAYVASDDWVMGPEERLALLRR